MAGGDPGPLVYYAEFSLYFFVYFVSFFGAFSRSYHILVLY